MQNLKIHLNGCLVIGILSLIITKMLIVLSLRDGGIIGKLEGYSAAVMLAVAIAMFFGAFTIGLILLFKKRK